MKRRAFLALFAALSLTACSQPPAVFKNQDLTSEKIFPSANLVGADGRPQDLTYFRSKVLIVFFGYTSCPDICPSAMRKFASVLGNMRSADAEQIQVVFISVDPARDTAEKADTYVKWFNPGFIGLTGSDQQIADVASQFKAYYSKQPVAGGMGYVIDHSASAYVLDKKGQLRLSIPEAADAGSIKDDLSQLLQEP